MHNFSVFAFQSFHLLCETACFRLFALFVFAFAFVFGCAARPSSFYNILTDSHAQIARSAEARRVLWHSTHDLFVLYSEVTKKKTTQNAITDMK